MDGEPQHHIRKRYGVTQGWRNDAKSMSCWLLDWIAGPLARRSGIDIEGTHPNSVWASGY
jgi:hypothetical protein